MEAKKDPELYRRMSEPYADLDAANDAFNGFFKELYDLREKHRIADVHIVASVPIMTADGETASLVRFHIGDSMKAESMLAYAFGSEQAQRESEVLRMLAQGKRSGSKK